jgi:four helix bundle protein
MSSASYTVKKANHMSDIKSFRDLEAWQVAMELVVRTYTVSNAFPRSELYGLTAQLRRAAVSVPSNIAEGQARGGRAGLNHISIAIGSLAELDTQLEAAQRLAYVTAPQLVNVRPLLESSRRLLYGLRRAKRLGLGLSVAGPACVVLFVLCSLA